MAKAPGKAHRLTLSLVEIVRMFPDNATAEAWFAESRWPDGVQCPACGSDNVQVGTASTTQPYRCRERKCRRRFSVKTGTVMQSSNLDYQTWAIAVYLCLTDLKGVSSMKLHRDLKITQKSAWHLAHRLRAAFEAGKTLFDVGPVEADETYIGGKRKNMPRSKRKELTGRGAVGKEAVVGVKDRETKRVVARHVEGTAAEHVAGHVVDHVWTGSTVYTDEGAAYTALDPFYDHETVNHSVGEYVRGQAHTNGMESFWSMLKRGYQGTYHKMSPKHLDRYVSEFSGRHNVREQDTIDQMSGLITGMAGRRLRYSDLIADNGLDSGARGSYQQTASSSPGRRMRWKA